jgi:hypothetical protein
MIVSKWYYWAVSNHITLFQHSAQTSSHIGFPLHVPSLRHVITGWELTFFPETNMQVYYSVLNYTNTCVRNVTILHNGVPLAASNFVVTPIYWAAWVKRNTSDLYQEGVQFQSQLEHRLPWLRFIVVSPRISGQVQRQFLTICHGHFLPRLSHFIIFII